MSPPPRLAAHVAGDLDRTHSAGEFAALMLAELLPLPAGRPPMRAS